MSDARKFHDGRHDGLIALESLDLDRATSFSGLLRGMAKTAFSGRSLGEALDVVTAMVKDADCKVVMTLSGAMTIAKMGKVISKMIDTGMVQAIVSTGALMAHGLSEAVGLVHYRHDPRMSDEELFDKGYNRVYDTLEMEANLNYVEEFSRKALDELGGEAELGSEVICRALGRVLAEEKGGSGVLRSAYLMKVPVYVPAFTDSELGLDLSTWSMKRAQKKSPKGDPMALFGALPRFNPYRDLNSYARFALGAKRLGIFTIGGGVPRNWAQEVGPYIDIMNHRLGLELRAPRFQYAVRICPEPTHWGGLSGCTYSEGVSWGKFVPEAEGGRFAEVYADATTVWPLLIKGVLEEMEKGGTPHPPRGAVPGRGPREPRRNISAKPRP
jgi:deoxyhypusine synthase